jgi:hypothetical protein
MIGLIFSYPHITLSYAVYFLAIPVLFIGLAGILKGYIVDVYSSFYRRLNILIGFLTIIGSIISVYNAEVNILISLVLLLTLLGLNGLLRSGLYLSEYGLSLKNLKNIKLVFYIMDNLHVVNIEEEDRF